MPTLNTDSETRSPPCPSTIRLGPGDLAVTFASSLSLSLSAAYCKALTRCRPSSMGVVEFAPIKMQINRQLTDSYSRLCISSLTDRRSDVNHKRRPQGQHETGFCCMLEGGFHQPPSSYIMQGGREEGGSCNAPPSPSTVTPQGVRDR